MTQAEHLSPVPFQHDEQTRTPAEMRDKVMQMEAVMLAMPERQIEIPLKHYFAPGIYMREMTMPKDATVTGKIHKTEHYCILTKGKVSVLTDEGMRTLEAPSVVHSLPGIKRALYAHEEVVWINVHHNPTNERDLDKIEEIFTAKTFEEALSRRPEAEQIQGGM